MWRLPLLVAIAVFAGLGQPAPAAAQRPGSLIEARPVAGSPSGMRAWRIRYWTMSDADRPIQVSGMVIAPATDSPRGSRRVIAWAHGTSGVAVRCAPSAGDSNFTVIPALGELVRRDFVVVAPDYPGLGLAGPHVYLGGVSTGRSVLDGVRAARALRDVGAGPRFAVWGESQGGHAALWTGQLARAYAPELALVGIAAIVPPTDLARNLAEGSDPAARAMLMSFTAVSWSRHYRAPITTFGRRPTTDVMTRLADNNCLQLNTRPRLGTIIGIGIVQRAIRNLDLSRVPPWAALMRRNSASPDAVVAPLLIVAGTADTIVAPAVTRDFARSVCARSRPVRYISVQGGEHATVARSEAGATIAWLDDRFSGRSPPDDCRRI